MNSLILGLYGVYLMAAGIQGHAKDVSILLQEDAGNYLPWLVAVIVLAMLYSFDNTRDIVMPILVLLILNFFLRNWDTVSNQFSEISALAKGQ